MQIIMRESQFPVPVADVVATLIDLCRHQRRSDLVELLSNAWAHFDDIDYDNWNGGTTSWALRLDLPVATFASVQDRLAEVEKELLEKLDYLNRLHSNDPLTAVMITPLTPAAVATGQQTAPAEIDVRRLWPDNCFRLFLSHVATVKVAVSDLKRSLLEKGVAAFVAHEDIEPSKEWEQEIILALRSMHGLAALITPTFHQSKWTDQEIGWALGRGVPVIPVRLGENPYGFVGKTQAVSGSLDASFDLSLRIVRATLQMSQTRGVMRSALVEAFRRSDCFHTSRTLKDIIVGLDGFSNDEVDLLRTACTENKQVSGSNGVVDAICAKFGPERTVHNDDLPF